MRSLESPSAMANSQGGHSVSNQEYSASRAVNTPSIISSRMTDVASEEGLNFDAEDSNRATSRNQRRDTYSSVNTSRPGTGVTGVSSQQTIPSRAPPSRRGYAHAPGLGGQSIGFSGSRAASSAGRPPSAASRTHVPSITSHAFFRPMSSQRLQAQRGGTRPSTNAQQAPVELDGVEKGHTRQAHSSASTPSAMQGLSMTSDPEMRPPASRGTDTTHQEIMDRATAEASPSNGHYPGGSLTESVRPLQQSSTATKRLSSDTDNGLKSAADPSVPIKTQRSFRSSFLLSSKAESAKDNSPLNSHGRENLSSTSTSPDLGKKTMSDKVPKTNLGNNYQYFTGNTVFAWGGRLQNTRERPLNVATGLLALLPGILFFVFSAPYIWHHISPAIPILFAYLYFICMSSFVHASVTDPGILPRNLHPMPLPDENDDPLQLTPPTNDWALIKAVDKSDTPAMDVPVKYCKTCKLWRPPRGHHCRVCDNCVETQDHHCVWLNNCVGRRNYRYFFTFVSSATLVSLLLLAASLAQLLVYQRERHTSFAAAIDHFRVPFAMVVYAVLVMPYPAALTAYHLFLMGRGETTREYLFSQKFPPAERHRPFSHGSVLVNWAAVLCRPRPPTYLGFKQKYEEGDQRFGEKRTRASSQPAAAGEWQQQQQQQPPETMELHNVGGRQGSGFQGPTQLGRKAEPRL